MPGTVQNRLAAQAFRASSEKISGDEVVRGCNTSVVFHVERRAFKYVFACMWSFETHNVFQDKGIAMHHHDHQALVITKSVVRRVHINNNNNYNNDVTASLHTFISFQPNAQALLNSRCSQETAAL